MSGTYEGWTNRETWNVKLWMDNEYDLYLMWQESAALALDVAHLLDQLIEGHDLDCPTPDFDRADPEHLDPTKVNWGEIAEELFNEVRGDHSHPFVSQDDAGE